MRTRPNTAAVAIRSGAIALLSVAIACAADGTANTSDGNPGKLTPGSGSFLFMKSPGSREHPVRVWYHIPPDLAHDARVLITMHGSGGTARPGRSNRDAWRPLADSHGFIVLAPEFSWAEYPGYASYHWGNMHTEDGEAVDSSLWAYRTVAGIFDEARRLFGITTPKYTLYGHSAGAQFVHRMMIFQPDPRVDVYISANPGNYTMASLEWKYPYGLDKGDARQNEYMEELLRAALQRPFLLLVGSADTATALSANNMRPEAMAQGRHRLERSRFFFNSAEQEAERRGIPFRWEFRLVPGVAHDNAGMAEGAVRALGW